MRISDIDIDILTKFRKGAVIPATPLALTESKTIDEQYQRALVRYYIDCGVGGIAIGVHSTQFEIREYGMFEELLTLVSEEIDAWSEAQGTKIMKIAGVCGKTEQALKEASFAEFSGYHAALVSLSAFKNDSLDDIITHCRKIAEVIPVIGFYMQTSVGGITLPYEFWKEFAAIPNVLGIKMAPFDRYKTLDVVRAICDSGKENDITLYTGNDDNIVIDLLSEYKIKSNTGTKRIRIKGGLLGHWCVWTKKAVELLDEIQSITDSGKDIPAELLTRAIQITDSNGAFFDPKNKFAGCISGLHEVLYRQGLMRTTLCLSPKEILSAGQKEDISRVYDAYPDLNDDEFIRSNLDKWLV